MLTLHVSVSVAMVDLEVVWQPGHPIAAPPPRPQHTHLWLWDACTVSSPSSWVLLSPAPAGSFACAVSSRSFLLVSAGSAQSLLLFALPLPHPWATGGRRGGVAGSNVQPLLARSSVLPLLIWLPPFPGAELAVGREWRVAGSGPAWKQGICWKLWLVSSEITYGAAESSWASRITARGETTSLSAVWHLRSELCSLLYLLLQSWIHPCSWLYFAGLTAISGLFLNLLIWRLTGNRH